MFAAILVIFTVFAGQLLRIQAFDASATQAAAFNKRLVQTLTPAMRGQILDTNGQVLADSVERYTIAANPNAVPAYKVRVDGSLTQVGVAGAVAALAPLLDMSASDLTAILTRPKTRYAIVKKEVNPAVFREIRALGIPGISGEKTAERIYPTAMAAGEIVGFVHPADQNALGGGREDARQDPRRHAGRTVAERARDGYIIPGSQRVDTPVVNGRDVKLTIDADLQWYAQNALAKQVTGVGAESGTAVVIEVATGKIRAAASYPTYDSNDPAASKSNLANRAFWEAFEPGSTGKLMTMAAALEQKIVTPDTGVIVPVRLPRAGIRFKDNEPHGVENMTATGVIAKSSNMGTMLIGERVPPDVMESYYRKFGVGSKTPVNFPGESAGQLAKAKDWNAAQRYTLLFGQGYSVTAVQATSVFATIANKGVRVPPSLIEGTVDDSGNLLPAAATTPTRVVSEDTAVKLSRMMEEVTGRERHRERRAHQGLPRRRQDRHGRPLRRGPGRYNGFTASFIGYAPAEKPKYVVGVFIQKPSAGMFGGMLAGPVFNQVMTYLIERTGAPPSTKSTSTTTSGPQAAVRERPERHQQCAGEAGWPVSWDDVSPTPLRPATSGVPLHDLTSRIGAGDLLRITAADPAAGDVLVTGVSLDSRAVSPGDLYAALPGFNVHGADFAADAIAAGAVAVLTDPAGLERRLGAPTVPVLVGRPPPRGPRRGRGDGLRTPRRGAHHAGSHGDQRQDDDGIPHRVGAARPRAAHRAHRHGRDPHRRRAARLRAHDAGGDRPARPARHHARAGDRRVRHGGLEPRPRAAPGRRCRLRRRALHQPLAGPPRLPREHGGLLRRQGLAVHPRPFPRRGRVRRRRLGSAGWRASRPCRR